MNIRIAFWLAYSSLPPTVVVADWPQFRGPKGDGESDAKKMPVTWRRHRQHPLANGFARIGFFQSGLGEGRDLRHLL